MTTAMDKWAAGQGNDGDAAVGMDDGHVHEGDITGGETDFDSAAVSVDAAASEEDIALAAKKAKDKKILMIAGGVVGAIVLAVGGMVLLKPASSPTQGVAIQPVQMAPAQATEQPQAQTLGAEPVLAEASAPMAAPAPMDFGLQAAPATQPAATSAPVMQVQQPAAAVQPLAPVPMGIEAPATPKAADGQASLEQLHQVTQANTEALAAINRRLDEMSAQMAVLKSAKPVSGPQVKPAGTSQVKAAERPATVSKKAEKPFVGITEKAGDSKPVVTDDKYAPIPSPSLSEPKATPSAPLPVAKGGRVRSDFTVYAVSNGRAWVHWTGDGENHMVGPNSVLPDNSRVTAIDDVKGVVMTNAGEVHPKPAK